MPGDPEEFGDIDLSDQGLFQSRRRPDDHGHLTPSGPGPVVGHRGLSRLRILVRHEVVGNRRAVLPVGSALVGGVPA